jgi:GTP-binding protein Era
LKDEAFFNKITFKNTCSLLLNKIDNSNQEQLENKLLLDRESANEIYPISALQNFNVPEVFKG